MKAAGPCGIAAACAFLVLVDATSISAQPNNQPYGTYRLGDGRRWVGTVGGVKLGPCGDEALKTLASHAVLVVEYSKGTSDIVVNGERWKDVWVEHKVFARKRDTPGYLLTLRFSRKKKEAEGLLVYMRVDSDSKPVCVDALDFTGSYKRG